MTKFLRIKLQIPFIHEDTCQSFDLEVVMILFSSNLTIYILHVGTNDGRKGMSYNTGLMLHIKKLGFKCQTINLTPLKLYMGYLSNAIV